jgi:hypothetical protein
MYMCAPRALGLVPTKRLVMLMATENPSWGSRGGAQSSISRKMLPRLGRSVGRNALDFPV